MFSNIAPKLSASEIEAVVSRVTSRFPGTEITYFLFRNGVTWGFAVSTATVPAKKMAWTVGSGDLEALLVGCAEYVQNRWEKEQERLGKVTQEKESRQARVHQFREALLPAFHQAIQGLGQDQVRSLGYSTNDALVDCDALEFTVRFRASTPEEAVKQVKLLQEFIRVFCTVEGSEKNSQKSLDLGLKGV